MAEQPVAKETTSLYRLTRRYWDGWRTFEEGDLVRFKEGMAPSSAVLVSEQEVPEVSSPVPAAGTGVDD